MRPVRWPNSKNMYVKIKPVSDPVDDETRGSVECLIEDNRGVLIECTIFFPVGQNPLKRRARNAPKGDEFWRLLDWSKSSSELARTHKVHGTAVSKFRAKFSQETLQKRPRKLQWECVDWALPVGVIAKKLGVTQGAVYKQKKMRIGVNKKPARSLGPAG